MHTLQSVLNEPVKLPFVPELGPYSGRGEVCCVPQGVIQGHVTPQSTHMGQPGQAKR